MRISEIYRKKVHKGGTAIAVPPLCLFVCVKHLCKDSEILKLFKFNAVCELIAEAAHELGAVMIDIDRVFRAFKSEYLYFFGVYSVRGSALDNGV